MPLQHRPIDFSWLAELPETYQRGQDRSRQNAMRDAFSGGLPKGSNGEIDFAAATDLLSKYDPIAALKLADSYQTGGASVYGTPIYGQDPESGDTVLGVVGKGGDFQRLDTGGVKITPGLQFLNQGTQFAPVDKRTGAPAGQPIPIDVTGENVAKTIGAGQGEKIVNRPKLEGQMRELEQSWDLVDQTIDRAITSIDLSGRMVSGLGGLLSGIPETGAMNLAQDIDTIKSNIGFDKLQSMRENSPTGGALGQVSDFENRLLQAVRGSLEQKQKPERLKANLLQIKNWLSALRAEKRRAFMSDYGGGQQQPSPMPATPMTMPGAPAAPQSRGPMPVPSKEQLEVGQVYNLPSGQQGLWTGEGFEVLN